MSEIKSIMNQWGKEHTPFVFLIDFECKKPMCWKWSETENIFEFNFDGVTNQKEANTQNHNTPTSDFEFNKTPISFDEYKNKFDQIKKEISITCYRNKLTKKVTGFNPKCPKGWIKK